MNTDSFTVVNGFKCYAPELAYEERDYSPGYFDIMYELESGHFWFQARNRIIASLFQRSVPMDRPARVLEIGVGTGFVLSGLSRFDNLTLMGAELYLNGLEYARRRMPGVEFVQLDATRMPFHEEFDGVGAYDTLEHIQEDATVMANVWRALKPGGRFFITVPQHPWLWSTQDDAAFHKRRYTRRDLTDKLHGAGFEIEYITSYLFVMFPLMVLSRLMMKPKAGTTEKKEYDWGELKLSPVVNTVSGWLTRVDEGLIRLGVSLPFGGSLAVVARKRMDAR